MEFFRCNHEYFSSGLKCKRLRFHFGKHHTKRQKNIRFTWR